MFKKITSLILTAAFLISPITGQAQSSQYNNLDQDMLVQLLLEIIQEQEKEKNSQSASQNTYSLQVGNRGSRVTELQQFLIQEKVYPEAIVSGYYGQLTERAVQNLRTKHNLQQYRGFSSEIYSLVQSNFNGNSNQTVDSEKYIQWVQNNFNADSYQAQGNLDFSASYVGRKDTFDINMQYKIIADIENETYEIDLQGKVILSGFLQDIVVPVDIIMIYKNDTIYFNVQDLPQGLLDDSLLGRWVEINLDDTAEQFDLDYQALKDRFTKAFQDSQNQTSEMVDFITITKSTNQPSEKTVNYNLQFEPSIVTDIILEQFTQEEINNPLVQSYTEKLTSLYEQFFSETQYTIVVQDDTYITATRLNFDDVIKGAKRQSIFGGMIKEPDTQISMSFLENITNINKNVSIKNPRNLLDLDVFLGRAQKSVQQYMNELFNISVQSSSVSKNAKKINEIKQAALSMELARNQQTGLFPTSRNIPQSELGAYMNPFPEQIQWEDNR